MKLSIVLLNWNGKLLLKRFLGNLIKHTPNASIYVVDNLSDDGSIKFLQKFQKHIKIIRLPRNVGYAKAYNYALKNIDSDLQNSISKLKRQFLHAKTLGFIHPSSKKSMIFSSLLPKDLNNILKMLRNTEK